MNNEYQDRGNKKWSAMLLPEHRERLRQMAKDEHKVVRPRLDADQWEDLNYKLQSALMEKRIITMIYFQNNSLVNVTGKVLKHDPITHTLHIQESHNCSLRIKLSDIVDVIDL